jgi:hypothetical protein
VVNRVGEAYQLIGYPASHYSVWGRAEDLKKSYHYRWIRLGIAAIRRLSVARSQRFSRRFETFAEQDD